MSKGLDVILAKIKEQPSSTLISRYLALIAELQDDAEKSRRALDVADVLSGPKPADAMSIAYMVHQGDPDNLRAYDILIACFIARGRYAKAEVLKNERARRLAMAGAGGAGAAGGGGLGVFQALGDLSLSRAAAADLGIAEALQPAPTVKLGGVGGPAYMGRAPAAAAPALHLGPGAPAAKSAPLAPASRFGGDVRGSDLGAARAQDQWQLHAQVQGGGGGAGPDPDATAATGVPALTRDVDGEGDEEPTSTAGGDLADLFPTDPGAGAHRPDLSSAEIGEHANEVLAGFTPSTPPGDTVLPFGRDGRPRPAPQSAAIGAPAAYQGRGAPAAAAQSRGAPAGAGGAVGGGGPGQAGHPGARGSPGGGSAGQAGHPGSGGGPGGGSPAQAGHPGSGGRPGGGSPDGGPDGGRPGGGAPVPGGHYGAGIHQRGGGPGSAGYPPPGAAAVSLRLDDDDGLPPAAFPQPGPWGHPGAWPQGWAPPGWGAPQAAAAMPPWPAPHAAEGGPYASLIALIDRYLRLGFLGEARELLRQTAGACYQEPWWQARQALVDRGGRHPPLANPAATPGGPGQAAGQAAPGAVSSDADLPPLPPLRGEDFWRPLQTELGRLAQSAKTLLVPLARVERLQTLLAANHRGQALPAGFVRALAELDHRVPGLDTQRLLALKWDLIQGLWGGAPDRACVQTLEELGLTRATPGFWGLYLDGLIASGSARKALVEVNRGLTEHPQLPWARIAWARLPVVWTALNVHGWRWAEDEGVAALRARLAQRPRPKLASMIAAPRPAR